MLRACCFVAIMTLGCQPTPLPSQPVSTTKALSDDELMRDYLRIQKEHVEALESKLEPKLIDEIAKRSATRLRDIQGLPQDRRERLDARYGRELNSLQERLGKAR